MKAVTASGSELLEEAQPWVESAAAGITSFTSESRELLGVVEQNEAAIEEKAVQAEASMKQSASATVNQLEEFAATAVAGMDNAIAAAGEAFSHTESESAVSGEIAAESAGTGHLKQAEGSVAEVISAVGDKASATIDAAADAESKAVAAAQTMGERGADAAKDALEQVQASNSTVQSEATKAKATLASVVSPTDIKAAANAAMRASSVMEHLAQRSVSSMSSVKPKVNTAVVWLLVP